MKDVEGQKGKSMAKKYSSAEKNAYYSGIGYAVAYKGRKINFERKTTRDSFESGWKRGIAMMLKTPGKYPPLDAAPKKKKKEKKKFKVRLSRHDAASGERIPYPRSYFNRRVASMLEKYERTMSYDSAAEKKEQKSWNGRKKEMYEFLYQKLTGKLLDGAELDGESETFTIYNCFKKTRAARYATDCFSDIVATRALRADWEFDLSKSYAGSEATPEELARQHSYFGEKLLNIRGDDDHDIAGSD